MGAKKIRQMRLSPTAPAPSISGDAWGYLFVAWLIALISTLGALFIGEVMGQAPCTLCWFQRVFMFPLVVILGTGLYFSDMKSWRPALPLAVIGALISGFHLAQFIGLIPESLRPCTQGVSCTGSEMTILGGTPIPLLALLAFATISTLLTIAGKRSTP